MAVNIKRRWSANRQKASVFDRGVDRAWGAGEVRMPRLLAIRDVIPWEPV